MESTGIKSIFKNNTIYLGNAKAKLFAWIDSLAHTTVDIVTQTLKYCIRYRAVSRNPNPNTIASKKKCFRVRV